MAEKKKALIVWGGWDGHRPEQGARLFERWLNEDGFDVRVSNTLDAFNDAATLATLDLIVPNWTMGRITNEQCDAVVRAVRDHGVGLAGCHGGMCDAFRETTEWQFMTGGQWVAHPGDDGVEYTVTVQKTGHAVTRDLPDFTVRSEQYYLHVDPAVNVLATTCFPVAPGPHDANGTVDMPVVWTKLFGKGRVFYNSIGHHPDLLAVEPCQTLTRRGFAWAAK